MDEDKDDPMMYIDPEILQKELVISLPILNESDIEMMINGVDTSSEDSSSSSVEDEKDKPCFKRDQRRLTLLNNPNYGTILCFMEKFRSYINLKNYPLRIFEDNLLSEQEKISGRFMDFHLNLLKKIVPGKTGGRTEFVTSMTKFAYRFNSDDGEHLGEYGYAKARIDTKLRILKNLLELQFDRNQQLKTAVADKPSFDIRTKPFGRDRFGASYWLFTDVDGFVRLFRENIDANCTWINLAKNSQELENIIKILITDTVVRKKFPDWKFSYEPFNNLSSSNKFEGDYAPDLIDIEENSNIVDPSSPTAVLLGSTFIKTENVNLDPVVSLNRDMPSSPLISSFVIKDIETKKSSETTSDQESINSEEINPNRLSTSSSSDTRDEIDSWGFLPPINENEQEEESINQVTTDKNNNDDNNNIIDNTANNNNTDVDDTNDINSNNDTVHMNVDSDVNNNNTADDDTSNINVNNDTVHMIVDNDVNNNNTDEDTGTINTDKNANNNNIINNTDDNNNNTQVVLLKPSLDQGIKRKLVDYDDTGSESENGNGSENENVHENRKIEESSRDSPPTPPINRPSKNNADLPLALRRPRRRGASRFAELLSDSSSTNDSLSQISSKKKNIDGSWKQPTHLYKTNTRRGRPRNRRKKHDFSSTTSDDRQPSDDDDDDFSEEYAVKNTELDLLLNGDFLEEEDDDDDYLPRRTAKTVAQYHELAEIQTKSCSTCSKTDRPEFLLLCENCNDAYHLECITPELLSVPEDDWYCPLCEHKRLCEKLIEKLIVIQNEEKYFEMKRRLSVSKRRKRLTNVTVNVERYVKQPIKRISSTDEDKEDEIKPKPILNKNKKNIIDDDEDDDDDDDDSVYGRKNDENRKPSDHEDNEEQQSGKRRVRACRRKPQNYSLDDYDKKIKKAMIDAGINKELVENDSDDSDESVLKRRPAKNVLDMKKMTILICRIQKLMIRKLYPDNVDLQVIVVEL